MRRVVSGASNIPDPKNNNTVVQKSHEKSNKLIEYVSSKPGNLKSNFYLHIKKQNELAKYYCQMQTRLNVGTLT
jgi:hypothetical protein